MHSPPCHCVSKPSAENRYGTKAPFAPLMYTQAALTVLALACLPHAPSVHYHHVKTYVLRLKTRKPRTYHEIRVRDPFVNRLWWK